MEQNDNENGPNSTPRRATISSLLRERWPEYVLEIVVIIFSITISFALDEWKDGRSRRELEQTYLKGLTSDIQADTSRLQEAINETRLVVQTAAELTRLGQQTPMPDYRRFVGQLRFVFKRPRFIAEYATFSDLRSTGNLQVISSFPLKKMLFDYYRDYEVIGQVETAELETTNSVVAPYVFRRFSLDDNSTVLSKTAWADFLGDPAFRNSMMLRRSTRGELLQNYQRLHRLGQQILVSINRQLK